MKSSTPLVSAVIPTRNRAGRIADAVRSILAQTYPDVEIVVVDDASEDGTEGVLGELAARHSLQIVRLPHAGGAAVARNVGAEEARGELVAFLDDDCRWHPSKLESQLGQIDEECRLVYCKQAVRSADGGEWIVEGRPPPTGGSGNGLLRANYIGTSTILVDRELFLKVGGFDQELRRLQDWDLVLRLSRQTRFGYVGDVLVTGLMVPGGISTDRQALVESARRIVADHRPYLSSAELGTLLYGLGKFLLADGDTEESREFFRASLRAAPTYPIGLVGLAASLFGPKFARAIRAWRRRDAARRADLTPTKRSTVRPHETESS